MENTNVFIDGKTDNEYIEKCVYVNDELKLQLKMMYDNEEDRMEKEVFMSKYVRNWIEKNIGEKM
jgi:hypothetical protein